MQLQIQETFTISNVTCGDKLVISFSPCSCVLWIMWVDGKQQTNKRHHLISKKGKFHFVPNVQIKEKQQQQNS